MKVLVATAVTQGDRSDDYCFTVEGELAFVPLIECSSPERCGCGRGFAGLSSARATTTVMVVERPDLSPVDYAEVMADGLRRQGYIGAECSGCPDCTDTLWDVLDEIGFVTEGQLPGTVVERHRSLFASRGRLDR